MVLTAMRITADLTGATDTGRTDTGTTTEITPSGLPEAPVSIVQTSTVPDGEFGGILGFP
jgi:hypothetical protein